MRGLKIAAIASVSLLVVMVLLVGYLFLTAEVRVTGVEVVGVSAAQDPAAFEALEPLFVKTNGEILFVRRKNRSPGSAFRAAKIFHSGVVQIGRSGLPEGVRGARPQDGCRPCDPVGLQHRRPRRRGRR